MPKRIGVIGSRRRDTEEDKQLLTETFYKHYKEGDTIISGGCPRGGDKFAEDIADELFHYIERVLDGREINNPENGVMYAHMPDWELLGRSAGFVRNTYIARDCDILIALVAEDRTGGTEDTIKKANKFKKKVIII